MMSTTTRPEISEKNEYWLPKERFYELKHFCRQYPIWKKAYHSLDGLSRRPSDLALFVKSSNISDPTERCAAAREFYQERMQMVEQAAMEADPVLKDFILKAVTKGLSYVTLRNRYNICCNRRDFYECFRKFFWILNQKRE